MKFFLCVIGMVMIVEGLPYFAFPGKMKEMVQVIIGLDEMNLRKFGFVLMLAGLCIVYFVMGGFGPDGFESDGIKLGGF
ncbi:DUF2065 domain-containing protein [Desulfobacula phenolica]|uniref:DUF2065 domain-containing protein n=1 Tax=Desulfobacula phenolica TaxID=90732 RepID=A0A1H2HHF0_9BACT|nr:DUF2065 domain-containing protein [Desulfobacula phenolica]SDU31317.1 hypothetical protein SAMN04487931_106249 [Desulfobacula phenolica]